MTIINTQYKINEFNINIFIINEYSIKINVKNTTNNNEYYMNLNESDTYANTDCDNNKTLVLKAEIYNFIINCFEKKQFYDINTEIIKHLSLLSEPEEPDGLELIFSFKYEQFNFEYILSLFSA
jgi:hypothetical protein